MTLINIKTATCDVKIAFFQIMISIQEQLIIQP